MITVLKKVESIPTSNSLVNKSCGLFTRFFGSLRRFFLNLRQDSTDLLSSRIREAHENSKLRSRQNVARCKFSDRFM